MRFEYPETGGVERRTHDASPDAAPGCNHRRNHASRGPRWVMLLRSAGFSLVTVSSERRTRLTNELSTQHHFLRNLGRNHDGVTPTHGQQQFKRCGGGGRLRYVLGIIQPRPLWPSPGSGGSRRCLAPAAGAVILYSAKPFHVPRAQTTEVIYLGFWGPW